MATLNIPGLVPLPWPLIIFIAVALAFGVYGFWHIHTMAQHVYRELARFERKIRVASTREEVLVLMEQLRDYAFRECWHRHLGNEARRVYTLAQGRLTAVMTPNITCPKCGMTSYNPDDVAQRYCGHCHEFQ